MKVTKYHLIDKHFISLNAQIPVEVFEVKENKKVVHLLDPYQTVTQDILDEIEKAIALYILKEDTFIYEDFAVSNLKKVAKTGSISFTEKAKVIMQKAEHVMDELFKNPETLGNIEELQEVVDDLVVTILDEDFTIIALMDLAAHDYYTHTHSLNVSIYALSLGKFLGLKSEDLKDLGEAAIMHDLGKSKIKKEIINKNGKLTNFEFEYMQNHPNWSFDIAQEMGVTDRRVLYAIKHHHEKLDGSGYPDHIRGKDISLFARIISICDIFDALTTRRSYKDPVSTFNTLKMMKEDMSTQVDIRLVNSFIMMMHR